MCGNGRRGGNGQALAAVCAPMTIAKIYAHLSCSDLETSIPWFATLFGRDPDARPMAGLAEWHHSDPAGFQLFEDSGAAGEGTLTLIVTGLAAEHARLSALEPADIEEGDGISLVRLDDPDGNLVVLAEAA